MKLHLLDLGSMEFPLDLVLTRPSRVLIKYDSNSLISSILIQKQNHFELLSSILRFFSLMYSVGLNLLANEGEGPREQTELHGDALLLRARSAETLRSRIKPDPRLEPTESLDAERLRWFCWLFKTILRLTKMDEISVKLNLTYARWENSLEVVSDLSWLLRWRSQRRASSSSILSASISRLFLDNCFCNPLFSLVELSSTLLIICFKALISRLVTSKGSSVALFSASDLSNSFAFLSRSFL